MGYYMEYSALISGWYFDIVYFKYFTFDIDSLRCNKSDQISIAETEL